MGTYTVQPPDDSPPDEAALREMQRAAVLAAQFESRPPIYSYVLIGCFVAVFVVQLIVGEVQSKFAAGLVKPLVKYGEFWRLLTSATLHGGFIHIYFNSQALYNIGSSIEALSRRAHVPILFVVAALSGSLFSLYLMPETTSIGASGGILGLFGFLAVYGFKHKEHLPPNFLRNVMINLALIVGIGIVAYNYIDNAAHAGGFVAGLIYGLLTIRKSDFGLNKPSTLVSWLGILAAAVVVAAALFSIYLMLTFSPEKYSFLE